MKSVKGLLWIGVIFFCAAFLGTAYGAQTTTISGTVTDITTVPNMIAIDDGSTVTEVYGIKFSYLENQYGIVIEIGTEVSVEAYENLCYDGTVRLKAASITVGDASIDLGNAGSGSGRGRRPNSNF